MAPSNSRRRYNMEVQQPYRSQAILRRLSPTQRRALMSLSGGVASSLQAGGHGGVTQREGWR